MDRKIKLQLLNQDRLKADSSFIGHEEENNITTLVLLDEEKVFEDFNVHFKFNISDDYFITETLERNEVLKGYSFTIPKKLLKKGNIYCQILFLDKSTQTIVKQSSTIAFQCGASLHPGEGKEFNFLSKESQGSVINPEDILTSEQLAMFDRFENKLNQLNVKADNTLAEAKAEADRAAEIARLVLQMYNELRGGENNG